MNVQRGLRIPRRSWRVRRSGNDLFSLTTGVTITPQVPKNPYVANVIVRPELRWDTTLNDTTPFAGGTKRSQVTFGFDAIVPFTVK